MLGVLIKIERLKLHRTLGFSSLFTYTVSALELSEPVAYALISVARKAKEFEVLNDALRLQRISVSRASQSYTEDFDRELCLHKTHREQKANARRRAVPA